MPTLTRNGIRPVLSAVFMAMRGIFKMFLKGFHRPALAFFGLLLVCGSTCLVGQKPRLMVPVGHTAHIGSVAFSPDGRYVLTGSGDNTAKLWDLSGRVIQAFSGHVGIVTAVAFSPDGKQVLTGSSDNTAKLWDLSGQIIQTFSGDGRGVNAVAFSPDGKRVLMGGESGATRLLNLSGRKIQDFYGHVSGVLSVAFSPDGKQVLTGSYDKTVKLWNLSGREIQTFTGHTNWVSSVAFSTDGEKVLTGSWDDSAKLWDLSGQVIQNFTGHASEVSSVAFSPNGKQVLTGSGDNTAKLWDLSGKEKQIFTGHASFVMSVAFSPDGKHVLTGSYDNTAKLWDLSGRVTQNFKGHASNINVAIFSSDGKKVLSGSGDGATKLWDLSGRMIQNFFSRFPSDILSVAFSPDGQYILASKNDATAKLWDLSGRAIQNFKGVSTAIRSVAFSPDGNLVLTSTDFTAKLWDLSGQIIQTFTGHTNDVCSAVFSPDGKQVLTGSYDNTAKLWDLSGREIQTFTGHTHWISSVAFSPDGKKVLTGSWDNSAKLWDLSGQVIQTFTGHTHWISSVAFSPDGKQVLTGSFDHKAKLWGLNGFEIQTFSSHLSEVNSAAFSPDGKKVVTGSEDGTVKLWSLTTGQELATLIASDSTDWIVTTPSGLFDASPGAMKLMYYVQGLEVIELDQLKERYYEPGLLAKVMGFDPGELRNVAAFDQVELYPEVNAAIEKDLMNIELTERNGGMGKLSLFINGKEVLEDINPKRQKSLSIDLNTFSKYYQTNADNTLALRTYNKEGWLKSQAYELAYRPIGAKGSEKPGAGNTKPASNVRPSLYAIVVGTSDYAGDRLDLRFADQDATAMSQALKQSCSALFGADRTTVRLLSSAAGGDANSGLSNKTNIRQAFADIAAKATPSDVLMVYFSGHGLAYGPAEKEQFYYLTKDIGSEDLSDPIVRDNYTISSNEFTQWLTAIPAQKQVMILDACNSGKVVESLAAIAQKALDPSQIRALDRMKDRTGMFILTGSAADKVSYEAGQYGQGLLTYSLLQGMSGLALTEDKRVDVMTLFQYSRDKVPELAKGIGGIQTPVLAFPAGGSSFDIGIVTPQVKIPVAQVKPVFIRNVFQDENNFDDGLGLTTALAAYFQQITARGAQAEIIYVDVNEYENAYSIKGLYSLNSDAVTVRGRLFKGKTSKGEFTVTGKKTALPALVEGIVDKVSGMIN